MTVVSVLVALLLLGILITVHEFGHYIFARMTGIEVMEFAIGFGPKIVGWTGKSGTKFALRCIPLGGYCAFYGEDDVEGKATNDPRAFGKQPVWKRMLSVLMGPGMNFLLPLVVLVLYFWIGGVTGTEASSRTWSRAARRTPRGFRRATSSLTSTAQCRIPKTHRSR